MAICSLLSEETLRSTIQPSGERREAYCRDAQSVG